MIWEHLATLKSKVFNPIYCFFIVHDTFLTVFDSHGEIPKNKKYILMNVQAFFLIKTRVWIPCVKQENRS